MVFIKVKEWSEDYEIIVSVMNVITLSGYGFYFRGEFSAFLFFFHFYKTSTSRTISQILEMPMLKK